METEHEKKSDIKQKALRRNDCGESNTPFSQSVGMNRGESDVEFPAQMMGFDIKCAGRISSNGSVCVFDVVFAGTSSLCFMSLAATIQ